MNFSTTLIRKYIRAIERTNCYKRALFTSRIGYNYIYH